MSNWKPIESNPVKNAYFFVSNCDEDQLIRDMMISCASTVPHIEDTKPTILSLQDTIDLIIKKYGNDWRNHPECKCTVIWASSTFTIDHIKKIVPELFDLCLEYRKYGTVNGKNFPDNFYLLAFAVIEPNYQIKDYT